MNLSLLRGQAYDGTGNRSGLTRGIAAQVAADYPIYLHCASHCLNLDIVRSFQVTCAQNIISVI